jgi:DNA replication protein DnaC
MPGSAVVKPCPECEGRGWIVSPDGGAGTARACSCRLQGLAARRFAAAGLPERYAHCRLANFLVSSPAAAERDQLVRARAAAQAYVDGFFEADGNDPEGGGRFRESGLLFVGPAGAGKTHLAVAVLAELVERYKLRARFAEFTSLVYQIQATFDPGKPGSQQEVLGPLLDAELLLLDELGAHQPTPWIRDVLYYLVNQRYLRRRPTLFTTNYRLERPAPRPQRGADRSLDRGRDPAGSEVVDEAGLLATRISAPLVSRLYEMAQPVDLTGVGDFRRDHKAARARV